MTTRKSFVDPRSPQVIAFLALVLVAVVLALGYQSFKATEQAAFDEFNKRQLVLAKEAASGIALYFETLVAGMKALARMPGIRRLDEATTRRELQHKFDELAPQGVNDIGVLDAAGVVRYNVAAHHIEGTDFSWRRYFQQNSADEVTFESRLRCRSHQSGRALVV